MQTDKAHSEWQTSEHALSYLARQDKLPHRTEGEKVLLSQIPQDAKRVLDLGTGDGRLLALIKLDHPNIEGVALDFSEPMLEQAKKRFGNDKKVTFFKHDLALPLPTARLGTFDAVISSLAIHHLEHPRKEQLYVEIYKLLNPKGVFCNLEHVSSSTENLHLKFLAEINMTPQNEDPSNKLLDCETQLGWLRKIGYADVDCYWKWFEVALLVGFKSA
ncbi:MAG: class I SAM-dependent methyltransferase [Candidatus Bathyarchaeota archaeon]|nr:class I SAM-dependent methyltransferase [Candidatus Bathyarchaeota archaeon]